MKYRIREHRKARKWRLADLADVVGTSPGHLSDIETGKREPGPKMLEAIAKALGLAEASLYSAQSEDERRLFEHMAIFQKLSPEDQAAIDRLARGLLPNTDD